MIRIGLISDTHGYLDKRILDWFSGMDEIWHAGDIGSLAVLGELQAYKPLRAVYGNIDGQEIRAVVPQDHIFKCESLPVWITHIGGYPGRYQARIRNRLKEHRPGLLVCGHSHILKVMYDKTYNLMFMNPGAAGKAGPQKVRTAVRFHVTGDGMKDLEVLELER